MCSSNFVHLHNHTEYSFLDGANRIPRMVQRAVELNQPALAISDHGAMFGCMNFYWECKKQGIKPIIGMEAYIAPESRHKREGRRDEAAYHLLLLARNEEGYRNLCRLHSIASLQGFYYVPRIDREVLRQHSGGLISSTTCLGSEINQLLMKDEFDRAIAMADEYRQIFDEGCYFVELQNHGIPEQKKCNEGLVRIARDLNLPLIVTNDAHFLCKTDAPAHDALFCIGTGKLIEDQNRLRFRGEEYIKSYDEMASLFPDYPEAISNTLLVAEMCDLELGKTRNLMPTPDLPEGATPQTYLRQLSEEGLRARVPMADESTWERLNYELKVIETTGFDSYFLLVREFAQYTRQQDIMFGVRGSAAGSLVSYTLGITDINPVEYDLTFERFLNPERVSMPDVDMDFQDDRRDEIIRYVTERFGEDQVAQIVTFGTLGAKQAIRDVMRVMGEEPREADALCKLLPKAPGLTFELALTEPNNKMKEADQALARDSADFRARYNNDPKVREIVDLARELEGLNRHAGVHAAGVVISGEPLAEIVPLARGQNGQAITGYEMGVLEKLGLLKMDFLGLSNLTVLALALGNINRNRADKPLTVQDIPLEDEPTYAMLGRGETVGVFQLESGGMRRNIMALRPQNVRELAAMVALYRPGPLKHIARFVDNKHGRQKPEYLHPVMEPILEETYGIIVYQDQVLKLVQAMAGFSLGKADILRRAMGKKDEAIMTGMRAEFIAGCQEREISEKVAAAVWELLLPFAGYAFNKAHAVCYAMLAHQTAYLKAHYPVEYMAALLAAYRDKEDRVTVFIDECRRRKIGVLPPDIHSSFVDFTIETKGKQQAIRFGLAAIKGVGEGLVNAIIKEREEGEFTHLYDFCLRLRPHGLNRGSLEALARAGTLDSLHDSRHTILDNLDGALVWADQKIRQRQEAQDSLFGGDEQMELDRPPHLPPGRKATREEILSMEKDVMGIYISDHPLRGYERLIGAKSQFTVARIRELEGEVKVTIAGAMSRIRTNMTKKGKMARGVLQDFTGAIEFVVFPGALERLQDSLVADRAVVLKGFARTDDRNQDSEMQLIVNDIDVLPEPESLGEDEGGLTMFVKLNRATRAQLRAIHEVVREHPGDYEVLIQVAGANSAPVAIMERVAATEKVIEGLRQAAPVEVEVYNDLGLAELPTGTTEPEPDLVEVG